MEQKARTWLAGRVRALRRMRGWSQEVLAELCGLHRTYIGSVERAERNISLDNIERIAWALEISVSDLVEMPKRDNASANLPHAASRKHRDKK